MKAIVFVVLLAIASLAHAQVAPAAGNPLLQKVSFAPSLGATLALRQTLHDADGHAHRLADFFDGTKPVAMLFGYYECHRLCETAIDALARAADIGGVDARLLFVGIDPRESVDEAARKRAAYRRAYGGKMADWRFLLGDPPAIDALKHSAGLRTTQDADGNIVHPAGVLLLTPAGRIAGFMPGVAVEPGNLRKGLALAARGEIGKPPGPLLLLCSNYDPSTGRYSLQVMRLLQLAALVMALAFVVMIVIRRRRSVR